MATEKKLSVWRDSRPMLSDEEWIVSLDDLDDGGASRTLSTHTDREDAIAVAHGEAELRGLPIEILPTHVGGNDGDWIENLAGDDALEASR